MSNIAIKNLLPVLPFKNLFFRTRCILNLTMSPRVHEIDFGDIGFLTNSGNKLILKINTFSESLEQPKFVAVKFDSLILIVKEIFNF